LIKVAISGVAGRMGREVLKTVLAAEDTELCAAIDIYNEGLDAGTLLGGETLGVKITSNLAEALSTSGAQVMVDFTGPRSVAANVLIALKAGVIIITLFLLVSAICQTWKQVKLEIDRFREQLHKGEEEVSSTSEAIGEKDISLNLEVINTIKMITALISNMIFQTIKFFLVKMRKEH